jgi:leucyl/phenylalanyl-tRNA--protein transferase
MFHRVSNASKIAVCALVERLRQRGFQLLDIQMLTPITTQLGGVEIRRDDYLARLARAVPLPVTFI